MQNYFHLSFSPEQLGSLTTLGLAHIGDAVYELLVRSWLCAHGLAKAGDLHRATVAHVAAPAQADFVQKILPLLSEQETACYKRGRNTHVHAIPKNASYAQYAMATGLEALFGSLYLAGQTDRINELFVAGMEAVDHAL